MNCLLHCVAARLTLGFREKKRLANEFDLLKSINGPEYSFLRTPPEPQQKFDVTIEQSTFTEEK